MTARFDMRVNIEISYYTFVCLSAYGVHFSLYIYIRVGLGDEPLACAGSYF